MLEAIILIVIALGLLATIIWAADKYLTFPAPFAWAKGIVMFVLIVVACYFIWDMVSARHLLHGHF